MRFQRRRILKNFSEVHTVKKASPHGDHVFQQIKISRTTLEKGHTRNNLVKLFQILTSGFGDDFLRISSCPKSPPPHGGHVFRRVKISRTIFAKGHTRNIPVKLFQYWTRGLREDFLRISSCPYSAKSPPLPHDGHVFRRIKISQTIF